MKKSYLYFMGKDAGRKARAQHFAARAYKTDAPTAEELEKQKKERKAAVDAAEKAWKDCPVDSPDNVAKSLGLHAEFLKAQGEANVKNFEEKMAAIEAAQKEVKDADEAKLKEVSERLETTIKALDIIQIRMKSGTTAPAGQRENLDMLIEKALTEALPTLKEMRAGTAGKGKELTITVKAAVNVMTTAVGNASGVTTPDAVVYQNINEYAADVRADAYIINFMDNGTTNKAALPYMDKLPTEGTMAITAEGALKPLISVSFELRYSQAEKIAGRAKVSEEALDDIPYLMSIIRNELKYEHDIAEQSFIFAKINAIAGAFVAGGMAASTTSPSNYDAIRAAIYGIKIASKGRYIPNAVLVPSADAYNMGATKDTTGQYVMPTFVLPDGTKISGVQVIEVNDDTVPEGSFVVGDFRKLKRRIYKGFTIRIGQGILESGTAANIHSDFESNMYTIVGESRLHLYVYENEKVAFTKSTFAAVKTAIEVVPV